VAQQYPDVLRCRLRIQLGDEPSEEELFDAIKVFQSTYATEPDLIPETDEKIVVGITAKRAKIDLAATLKGEWEEEGDLLALNVEVKTRRLLPDWRTEHAVTHRNTIRIPRTTDTTDTTDTT
jgi:hypothetical protein